MLIDQLIIRVVVAHDWRHEQHEHEGIFVPSICFLELGLGFDLTYVMTS